MTVPGDVVPSGIEPRDVASALAAAPRLAGVAASLGVGQNSATYLDTLRALGAHDLVTARVLEPHLDACAIAAQAGTSVTGLGGEGSTWGVYASRSPRLRAQRVGEQWTLTGEKPWCSLADTLTHALVTAPADDGGRLFAVSLGDPGVTLLDEPWEPKGLPEVRSTGVRFDDVPVTPVGDPGFYLGRDGFAWGGIGVAAVWFGGVDRLANELLAGSRRREPDQIALVQLGALEVATHTADAVLADAARRIDAGEAGGAAGRRLASTVRAVAASSAEEALSRFQHATGPGPMTAATLGGYLADLALYVRQHHAERDLAALGAMLLEDS